MPNTLSAKKRLRQNEVRRMRNRAIRSKMRGQIRKVREAVEAGENDKAADEYKSAAKQLDRAGARGIIHKNTAARTKSRLQKLLKSAKAAS